MTSNVPKIVHQESFERQFYKMKMPKIVPYTGYLRPPYMYTVHICWKMNWSCLEALVNINSSTKLFFLLGWGIWSNLIFKDGLTRVPPGYLISFTIWSCMKSFMWSSCSLFLPGRYFSTCYWSSLSLWAIFLFVFPYIYPYSWLAY